jgi:hypothetical protein
MADDASAPPEGSQETPLPKDVFSDSGLFYLHYSNDSGLLTSLHARADVAGAFFKTLGQAESELDTEYVATLTLQASVRRVLQRAKLVAWRRQAITVERVYRGHLGRNLYEDEQVLRDARTRRAFWNSNAALVQKIWRGFFSRKHVHNFYLRKAYLDSVALTGQQRREELNEHMERLMDIETQRVQQERLEKFERVVGSLHHMLSTGCCAGVYNSPYEQLAPATAFGLPIEEHLRNVAKGTLRATIMRTGMQQEPETWVRGPTGKESELGESYAHGPIEGIMSGGVEVLGGQGGQLYAYSTKPIRISRQ